MKVRTADSIQILGQSAQLTVAFIENEAMTHTPEVTEDPHAVDPPITLSARHLQHQAVRGGLWTIVHVCVSVPVAFGVNAIVARTLGASDYGSLAYLTLIFGILTTITNAGTSDGVIQWGAAAYARGDVEGSNFILRQSLGFHVLIQLPLLCVSAAALAWNDGPIIVACLILSAAIPCLLSSISLTAGVENLAAAAAKVAIVSNLLLQTLVALVAVASQTAAAIWPVVLIQPNSSRSEF